MDTPAPPHVGRFRRIASVFQGYIQLPEPGTCDCTFPWASKSILEPKLSSILQYSIKALRKNSFKVVSQVI